MTKNRRSQFQRAVERQGFCCVYAWFQEFENVDAEFQAELLEVDPSTIYYQKRKFREGARQCEKSQSVLCMARDVRYTADDTSSPQ